MPIYMYQYISCEWYMLQYDSQYTFLVLTKPILLLNNSTITSENII